MYIRAGLGDVVFSGDRVRLSSGILGRLRGRQLREPFLLHNFLDRALRAEAIGRRAGMEGMPLEEASDWLKLLLFKMDCSN